MNRKMTDASVATPRRPAGRRPWTPPALEAMPKLTELTLQTGSPIEGGGDTGGGSTVF